MGSEVEQFGSRLLGSESEPFGIYTEGLRSGDLGGIDGDLADAVCGQAGILYPEIAQILLDRCGHKRMLDGHIRSLGVLLLPAIHTCQRRPDSATRSLLDVLWAATGG